MIIIKVNITDKRLWENFLKVVSTVMTVISAVFTFVDLEQSIRLDIAKDIILILSIVFILMLIKANTKKSQRLKINDTDVNIIYGNIFSQDGIKVIAFNEFFDTKVDNRIISSRSLNGIYINDYCQDINLLNNTINNMEQFEDNIIEKDVYRKYGGKSVKYKLGTICPMEEYFLLAFSHFDKNNKAYLSLEDYVSCLIHMWNELDIYYSGRSISIPLLGDGITRFNNCDISQQELIKYIIQTFEISKVKFKNKSSLTIVLNNDIKDKVNLYNII